MNDTIAAVATAKGAGGIAIVRISGNDAEQILKQVFKPASLACEFVSHVLMYGRAVDENDGTLDEVMAVLMRAPRTYTREDVAEIQCHGGGVSAQAVLSRILECGARMALPGEFTKRAFMNGRIDLSKAEAVMQLIGANSQAAARASVRQLEGGVSGFVRDVSDKLTDVLALIEASTDFPDEVEEEAASAKIVEDLNAIVSDIDRKCDKRSARLLREGASIVLAGRPNVGKSSMMNALLNQERAIVTAIPGTTRDVLTERIIIGGISAEISDTAGRRDTDDPVEKIGVDRARKAAENADIVLIVLDASQKLNDEDEDLVKKADERCIVCLNKQDLEQIITPEYISGLTDAKIMQISAESGMGIDDLMNEMSARIAVSEENDGQLVHQRHLELARSAGDHLKSAVSAIEMGLPLDTTAIDLKEALEDLGQITGVNATEEVIDRVFANFCVGK